MGALAGEAESANSSRAADTSVVLWVVTSVSLSKSEWRQRPGNSFSGCRMSFHLILIGARRQSLRDHRSSGESYSATTSMIPSNNTSWSLTSMPSLPVQYSKARARMSLWR